MVNILNLTGTLEQCLTYVLSDLTVVTCYKHSSRRDGGDERLNDLRCKRGVGMDPLKRLES